MIRKAVLSDLDGIEKIYNAIHSLEEDKKITTGWVRGVYPTKETAKASISNGDMFVLEQNGEILAAGKINQQQDKEYALINWKHKVDDSEVMVFHTLVVYPHLNKQGYGTKFFAFYENYALEHGCRYLRIDTNVRNTNARQMYKNLGYEERGVIDVNFNGIPGVQLVCMEKHIHI